MASSEASPSASSTAAAAATVPATSTAAAAAAAAASGAAPPSADVAAEKGSPPAAAAAAAAAGRRPGFLCGVVEGFYGRPWTTEQRKDLFSKMGMNSYLYAPKDDYKHRVYWREPYTVEEADHLQSLIQLAKDCNIDFYYALSPGLDITYSSSKEVSILKRKLDQVSQLGCECFALLFDDIESEMCKQDKEIFQSFAQAQVTLTNDIFEHFNRPKFLFCPTQYCAARAVPSVRNSEYLNTIGSKLAQEIDVMWTGDKVISKVISTESLEDINDVLRRPCVIWDNFHANDYDQKRVFLGPYSGRSPELIHKLNGVMTNPNCEYGANFIAIHTLAQWSKCNIDGLEPYSNASDTVTADIKLEMQSNIDDTSCSDAPLPVSEFPPNVYHPKNALLKALREWIPEFSKQKTVWGPMSKPQVGLAAPVLLPIVNVINSTTAPTQPATAQTNAEDKREPGSDVCASPSQMITSPRDNSSPTPEQQPEQLEAQPQQQLIAVVPECEAGVAVSADSQQQQARRSSTSATTEVTPMSEEPSAAASNALSTTSTTTTMTLPTPVDSALAPVSLPVMNSLVSTNKVIVDPNVLSNPIPSLPEGSAINVPPGVNPIVAVANPILGQQVPATQLSASTLSSEPQVEEDGDTTMTPLASAAPTSVLSESIAHPGAVPPPSPGGVGVSSVGGASSLVMANSSNPTQAEDAQKTPTPTSTNSQLPAHPALQSEGSTASEIMTPSAASGNLQGVCSKPAVIVTNQLPSTVTECLGSDVPIVSEEAIGTDVMPGPTYLEPMETSGSGAGCSNNTPGGSNQLGEEHAKPASAHGHSSTDIAMETNPPTPGSTSMQVESQHPVSASDCSTSGLHKVESSTMLCEEDDHDAAVPEAVTGPETPLMSVREATSTISHNPGVTNMVCDEISTDHHKASEMTVRDLLLLSQLFYLAAEHGQIGHDLLNDFFWLKRNANIMLPASSGHPRSSAEERHEWNVRAAQFKSNVVEIHNLFVKVCSVQNRELVYDLYTYLWDMCNVTQMLEAFVQWISKGCVSPKSQNYVVGQHTWFSGIREAFQSGDHEPWMFRGGLVSDLQRLLPLDSGNDLYTYKFPEIPARLLYFVRPYQPKDEAAVYAIAANAYEETIDAPLGLCEADRQLVGDMKVGAYLTLCPEYAFVCENSIDGSIVGYAVAVPDVKTFYARYNMAWLPDMRMKYPMKKGLTLGAASAASSAVPSMEHDDVPVQAPTTSAPAGLTPIELMGMSIHWPGAEPKIPQAIVASESSSPSTSAPTSSGTPTGGSSSANTSPWGKASIRIIPSVTNTDSSLAKRLLMLMLASLRASGTIRLYVEPHSKEPRQVDFYQSLGFTTLATSGETTTTGPNSEDNSQRLCCTRCF